MAESIVTANRLADGGVVWLDSAELWTERLDTAVVLSGDTLQAALERIRKRDRDVVVDIRGIPGEITEGHPVPQARRERLRGAGPSVREDLIGAAPEDRWARSPFPEPPSATS